MAITTADTTAWPKIDVTYSWAVTMTTEQMKLIERALVHIVSGEQKQDKTNLAPKNTARRHVCFAFLNLARYWRAC